MCATKRKSKTAAEIKHCDEQMSIQRMSSIRDHSSDNCPCRRELFTAEPAGASWSTHLNTQLGHDTILPDFMMFRKMSLFIKRLYLQIKLLGRNVHLHISGPWYL